MQQSDQNNSRIRRRVGRSRSNSDKKSASKYFFAQFKLLGIKTTKLESIGQINTKEINQEKEIGRILTKQREEEGNTFKSKDYKERMSSKENKVEVEVAV